jgi:NDP-sugar pyrophosphorylase family protein
MRWGSNVHPASTMNAMILAAGRGTRLGALGLRTPKILVGIDGEPLLARQIRYLKSGGIERIVLNAHHLAEQVQSFVDAHPSSADIEVVVEAQLLGTAGGVLNARPRLGAEPFVVLYGDVIIDEPINALENTHRQSASLATIAVYQSDDVAGKGTVEVSSSGLVTAFHEKTVAHAGASAYVNAGLYLIAPSFLDVLPTGVSLDFGHDVFPQALARGEAIATHLLGAPVVDIGTPAALQLAREGR